MSVQNNRKLIDNYSGNIDNIEYIFTEKLANDFDIVANIIASLNFIKKDLDGVYLLKINHTNYFSPHSYNKIQLFDCCTFFIC